MLKAWEHSSNSHTHATRPPVPSSLFQTKMPFRKQESESLLKNRLEVFDLGWQHGKGIVEHRAESLGGPVQAEVALCPVQWSRTLWIFRVSTVGCYGFFPNTTITNKGVMNTFTAEQCTHTFGISEITAKSKTSLFTSKGRNVNWCKAQLLFVTLNSVRSAPTDGGIFDFATAFVTYHELSETHCLSSLYQIALGRGAAAVKETEVQCTPWVHEIHQNRSFDPWSQCLVARPTWAAYGKLVWHTGPLFWDLFSTLLKLTLSWWKRYHRGSYEEDDLITRPHFVFQNSCLLEKKRL